MVKGSPLLLNVHELRRAVGNQREVRTDVELDDLELTSARVPVGSALDIDLLLEAVSGGVSVTGAIRGGWDGECRRCLDKVSGDLTVDVAEVYEDRPTEGETYQLDGDLLDLEPMVRDLTLLALPLNPLCGPECAGPLPDELPVTVESDEVVEPPRDPRWAALDALRSDLDPDVALGGAADAGNDGGEAGDPASPA